MTQQLPNGSRWSRCLCGPKAAALMLTLLCSAPAAWAHDCEVDGIYYNLNAEEQTASVTYYGYSSGSDVYIYTGTVQIPEEIVHDEVTYRVTEIGDSAFFLCNSLTEVTIPNGVTTMGNDAFSFCSSLTAVHISDLDAWCRIQFANAYSNPLFYAYHLYIDGEEVTEVVIPEDVTEIYHTFVGGSSLTEVTIPNGVTTIGTNAFYGCSSLTEVTIPESVTTIGDNAFRDCRSLTEMTIPNSVTTIGDNAFRDCRSLTEVTIPNGVTTIGAYAFYDCSSLTEMTIPNSVATISLSTFLGCSSLTEVTIPESVTTIGQNAFYRCSSLTEVTIPNSVTTIGEDAFTYCSSLTDVTIGNSVTTIGNDAFYECRSLTAIHLKTPTPPSAHDFDETTYAAATLYVPTGSKVAYAAADVWSKFQNIIEEDETAALEGIAADAPNAGARAIYTLGGQRIEATDADALPAGLYIVGGKKVMKQ